MANSTTKPASQSSSENVLRSAHNEVDSSLTVNGFLVGKVGHKITYAVTTTNSANDTELYSFYDDTTLLYQIALVYTDGTKAVLNYASRIA